MQERLPNVQKSEGGQNKIHFQKPPFFDKVLSKLVLVGLSTIDICKVLESLFRRGLSIILSFQQII